MNQIRILLHLLALGSALIGYGTGYWVGTTGAPPWRCALSMVAGSVVVTAGLGLFRRRRT